MKLSLKIIGLFFVFNSSFANTPETQELEDILNPGQEPYFNYQFGISPFVGILGFEYQVGHSTFGVGLPGHISYRYYFDPYRDTKFVGVYLGKYSLDNADDTVEGILFRDKESSFVGIGAGKRWQWPSGWNFSLSLALEYSDDDYSNPGSSITGNEKSISLFPGINGGYKF